MKLLTKPFVLCVSTLLALSSFCALAGTVTTNGPDLVVNTDNGGLELHTADDAFAFKFSGKIQLDATRFDGLAAASENKPFASTTDAFVRRGQLKFEGTAFSDWNYGLRLNFDGNEDGTDVDWVWLQYNGFDFANITVGKYRVYYGLEGATSSSWITGMERPAMYDFLAGSDDTDFGIRAMHAGDNYSLSAQIATNGDKPDDGNNDIYGYTLRATYAPILEPDQILHLGVDYHDANPSDNETKLQSRFGIRSDADDKMRFADIDNTTSDNEYVLEAGYQLKGLRLQSEYFKRKTHGYNDEDYASSDIDGYYGQISYLFGASRKYDVAKGRWKKPTNFNSYEVFARYESIDINANEAATKKNIDNNVDGVEAAVRGAKHTTNEFTVGVNYFVNESIRTSLNYITYRVSNIDTSADIDGYAVKNDSKAVVARLQYVF